MTAAPVGPSRRTGRGRVGVALLAALLALAAPVGAATSAPPRVYDSITIVHPAAGRTIFDNGGNVAVAIAISPALRAGDRIVLDVDGHPTPARHRTRFELAGIDRGEHTLRARAVDGRGGLLIASAPLTFYLWHASRLFPSRRGSR